MTVDSSVLVEVVF